MSRRVVGARAAWLALAVLGLAGGFGAAHVRLLNPSTGNELFWQQPGHVSIVIQSAGSDDVTDGSHATALRNAIAAWNAVPGSAGALAEDTSPAQQARTDWQADDVHLVMFDETNESGFFAPGSSVVAITPLWFFGNGRIIDADVLFNGGSFAFTTSQQPGRYDIADVGAHELGHLLGLDHSGWGGATMYPYVDSTVILHRSLSLDDAVGLRSAYPAAAFASITGRIERADGSAVAGAHVVALDPAGRVRAGILSDGDGDFALTGLDAGTYTVYGSPLDGPVVAANLTGGQVVHVDFQPQWYASPIAVGAGASVAAGTLVVLPDAVLNVGRPSDRLPLRGTIGTQTVHTLRGSALAAGSTLTLSDPDIGVVVQSWLGSAVVFRTDVPAGEEPGHVDVLVENLAGERAVLTAALELAPPDPIVSTVSPSTVGGTGGTAVTITGQGFRPGLRLVVGPHVYVDGEPGGCTVVDDATIELAMAATPAGVHDVVAIDATGVEGRLVDGLTVAELPQVTAVFPPAGAALGGTLVTITGADFAPEAVVRLDGIVQADVEWHGSHELSFVTSPGLPGGPYLLEVENPGGHVASGLFALVAAPDPSVTSIEPAAGPSAGGTAITVLGAAFDADTEVVFGADAATGLGGAVAPTIVLVDGGTLAVVTPAGPAGLAEVIVRRSSTGQAALAPEGFVYQSSGGGGGGGGCHTRSVRDGGGGGGALGWALLGGLALLLGQRARQRLEPRPA